jgi:hypothetical protein
MKPLKQDTPSSIDARYRTMLILWFAMFMSIGIYLAIALLFSPAESDAADSASAMPFTIAITAVSAVLVLLSLIVKRKVLQRSVELQQVALVQQALIIACVMCEAGAILGMVHRFMFATNYYYLLFLISAIGFVLHFPRREQLLSASYKTLSTGAV